MSRILIVDDEKTMRDLLREAIRTFQPEWQVEEARNGVEAMERAIENPPHLVLLDIVMPDMGGLLVCQKLKEHPRTVRSKIIFITGKEDPDSHTPEPHSGQTISS